MTPAALGDSSINCVKLHRVRCLSPLGSFGLQLWLNFPSAGPLDCKSSPVCFCITRARSAVGSLTWWACIPLSCPLCPCPQCSVISALQSAWERGLGHGDGDLGCPQVALDGGQNNKMRGHALLPSKPKILSNILYPKGCSSAAEQSLGRSGPHAIGSVPRMWKGQQPCSAVPSPRRETKTQKGGNWGHQWKIASVNRSVFFCLRVQSRAPLSFWLSPLGWRPVCVCFMALSCSKCLDLSAHQVSNSIVFWGHLLWNSALLLIQSQEVTLPHFTPVTHSPIHPDVLFSTNTMTYMQKTYFLVPFP